MPDHVAMQSRCPHCLGEQYCLNVIGFSTGKRGCTVCGEKSTVMTYEQWHDALDAARQRRDEKGNA